MAGRWVTIIGQHTQCSATADVTDQSSCNEQASWRPPLFSVGALRRSSQGRLSPLLFILLTLIEVLILLKATQIDSCPPQIIWCNYFHSHFCCEKEEVLRYCFPRIFCVLSLSVSEVVRRRLTKIWKKNATCSFHVCGSLLDVAGPPKFVWSSGGWFDDESSDGWGWKNMSSITAAPRNRSDQESWEKSSCTWCRSL